MNSTIVVNISDNNGPSTTSTTMTSSSSSPPSSQQQQQMENTFLSSTKSLVNDNSISRHNTSPSTSSSTSSSTNITQYYQSQVHNNSNNIHNNSNVNNLQELIAIKSKFEAEFRRFSLQRSEITNVDDFHKTIEHFHKLFTIPFTLAYIDPIHGDLLPINNDINFALAIASAKPLLRLVVQRKDGTYGYIPSSYGNSTNKKNTFLGTLLPSSSSSAHSKPRLAISAPEDFRQVSSIIDVDIVPDTCRRVRLVKHGSDKPLGFYIRDGTSVRVTAHGVEKVPGIFISRLIPGGLAESTGLLAVNDEVLEVNGIEVNGKSLDQVTDMMVANSSNLIITIRPANQRGHTTLTGSFSSNTISSPHHQHHHPHHQLGGYSANQTNSLERPSRGSKAKSLIVTGPGGTMMATSTGFSGRDNVTSTMGGGVLGGGGLTIGDFHNPHHHHHHHHGQYSNSNMESLQRSSANRHSATISTSNQHTSHHNHNHHHNPLFNNRHSVIGSSSLINQQPQQQPSHLQPHHRSEIIVPGPSTTAIHHDSSTDDDDEDEVRDHFTTQLIINQPPPPPTSQPPST